MLIMSLMQRYGSDGPLRQPQMARTRRPEGGQSCRLATLVCVVACGCADLTGALGSLQATLCLGRPPWTPPPPPPD